jgi:hypothetical protein
MSSKKKGDLKSPLVFLFRMCANINEIDQLFKPTLIKFLYCADFCLNPRDFGFKEFWVR